MEHAILHSHDATHSLLLTARLSDLYSEPPAPCSTSADHQAPSVRINVVETADGRNLPLWMRSTTERRDGGTLGRRNAPASGKRLASALIHAGCITRFRWLPWGICETDVKDSAESISPAHRARSGRVILVVEQALDRHPRAPHASCHLSDGDALLLHRLAQLPGEHALAGSDLGRGEQFPPAPRGRPPDGGRRATSTSCCGQRLATWSTLGP
jgi:hypothetical protein